MYKVWNLPSNKFQVQIFQHLKKNRQTAILQTSQRFGGFHLKVYGRLRFNDISMQISVHLPAGQRIH